MPSLRHALAAGLSLYFARAAARDLRAVAPLDARRARAASAAPPVRPGRVVHDPSTVALHIPVTDLEGRTATVVLRPSAPGAAVVTRPARHTHQGG